MDSVHPFVSSLGIALGMQAMFFVFAASYKTDKLTDFTYGLTFATLALFWLLADGRPVTMFRLTAAIMVVIWAFRLVSYLTVRIFKTGSDSRYDDKRNNLLKFGQFWLLQGLAVWLITFPIVYALSRDDAPSGLSVISVIGVLIWAAGLLFEACADVQLYRFRFLKDNHGKWIDEGLWHYSRHPNYFGEIMLWWGVFIFAMPVYTSMSAWITVLGPLTITGLLLFGSGVPILEKANDKRWGKDPEYRDYKKATSVVVPLPRKQSKKRS